MFKPLLSLCLALITLSEIRATDQHKRAPSGFTGVRGKKSIEESFPDTSVQGAEDVAPDPNFQDHDNFIDKRAPSGFMGMRGKKPFPELDDYPVGLYKRAPYGFMGMRGKKDMELANFADDHEKRAPMGFMGMRGKKESDFENDYYYDLAEKRAPMGFMGMRGKKDFEEGIDQLKRAPMLSGFFGTRGKKQPGRSSFFGMRGKKYPYEFRGKFVGVRGKKMSNEVTGPDSSVYDEQDLGQLAQGLDINQLMLLLTENERNDLGWENGRNEYFFGHQNN